MDIKILISAIGKIKNFLVLSAFIAIIVLLIFQESLKKLSNENLILTFDALIFFFFILLLILAFKDSGNNKKVNSSLENEESLPAGYKVLSKLLVFKYSDFNSTSECQLNILKVENYFFVKDGDYEIRSFRFDKDAINKTDAISDPLTTHTVGDGSKYGNSITKYTDVKQGESRILAVQSFRKQKIDGMLANEMDKEIMFGNAMKYLKKDNDSFAGTGFLVKTDHLRMLIYFIQGKCPKHLEVFQIDASGKTYKDHIVKIKHDENFLWIVDCFKPIINAELYAYWNWGDVS